MEEVLYKKLFEIPRNRNCFVAFVNLLELATFFHRKKDEYRPLNSKVAGSFNSASYISCLLLFVSAYLATQIDGL